MGDKVVAIIQSNYIPWKGYFDIINMVDEFVLYDDMQYTRRDWRNRNKIKTPNGLIWLTIPVEVKGKYFQKINETVINDPSWARQHWEAIRHNYAKAKYFKQYKDVFEELYLTMNENYLSKVNHKFIQAINKLLGITTNVTFSSDYELVEGKTERLVGLCKTLGATEYISGPAAKDYVVDSLFEQENIKLSWMDYSNYPEYTQMYPPFEHGVTVLDLLFNEGEQAPRFMKSFQKDI